MHVTSPTSSLVSVTVVVEEGGGRGEGVVADPGRLPEPSLRLGLLATREFLRAVTFLVRAGLCWDSSGGSEVARVLLSAAEPEVSAALADCREMEGDTSWSSRNDDITCRLKISNLT